jgi:prolyl oligopeptidase
MTSRSPANGTGRISYPVPRRVSQADDYHGEQILDPYRALEDISDPQTAAWVTAQNELTQSILGAAPARQPIAARLAELWNYPRLGVPFERGGRWFQTSNSGLQNQPVLYVTDDPAGPGRALIDPNLLSAEGTVALAAACVSPDGAKVAYATSESGSDWLAWQVRDVSSGADLGDVLQRSKSTSAQWRKDSSGFYYSAMRPPQPGRELADTDSKRIFFHQAGSGQQDDDLVFDPQDAAVFPDIAVGTDGRYLILSLSRGIGPGSELRVLDLERRDATWQVLLPASEAEAAVAGSQAGTFYLLTDAGADKRRIVAVDLDRPGRRHWREVVPAAAETLLEGHMFGGRLVCHYLRDACSLLRVFEPDGTFVRDPAAGHDHPRRKPDRARDDRGHAGQRHHPLRAGVVHRVSEPVGARPGLGTDNPGPRCGHFAGQPGLRHRAGRRHLG